MTAKQAAVIMLVMAGLSWASVVLAQTGQRRTPEAPAGGEALAEEVAVAAGENLLPNGDFEEAAEDETHPAHWQEIDNLVFFWTTDPEAPERGKVIKIDTDVYQRQAYAWWIERFVLGKPVTEAPKREATSGLKYDTIAGLDGGYYWSDFIEIKKGGAYKVYIDAKGPAALVFIRGYEKELPLSFGDEEPATQQQFRRARGEARRDKDGRPIKYRLRYQYTAKLNVGGGGGVEDVHARETSAPEQPGDHGERAVSADLHLSVLAAGDVLV